MSILGGNQKEEPLHYGEIYDLWQFSMVAKGCISANRAYQYHAGDKELKKVLGDIINQAELEVSECDAILINNGIVPSPALPERPETKLEDIPVGVRFPDQEIAAMIGAATAASLIYASESMRPMNSRIGCRLYKRRHKGTQTNLTKRCFENGINVRIYELQPASKKRRTIESVLHRTRIRVQPAIPREREFGSHRDRRQPAGHADQSSIL